MYEDARPNVICKSDWCLYRNGDGRPLRKKAAQEGEETEYESESEDSEAIRTSHWVSIGRRDNGDPYEIGRFSFPENDGGGDWIWGLRLEDQESGKHLHFFKEAVSWMMNGTPTAKDGGQSVD